MKCEQCKKKIPGNPFGGFIPRLGRSVWFCSNRCHAIFDQELRRKATS